MSRSSEPRACAIAREALTWYLEGKEVPMPDIAPGELSERAGAFVTWSIDSELRASMGTIIGLQPMAAREIAWNAFQAGVNDPRFSPVTVDELDRLEVTVDVLGNPVPSSNAGGGGLFAARASAGAAMALALPGSAGPTANFDDLAELAVAALGPVTASVEIAALPVRRWGAPLPLPPHELQGFEH